jgi:hypothetical protein
MDDRRRGLEHAGILFSHSLMCLTDLLQLQLPTGATLLGVSLSSDKMNITSLCGGRVAHPLLVSLANIKMLTHLKLSSSSFMLTALLPVPKFTHKNKRMRGVLEDRLIHQRLRSSGALLRSLYTIQGFGYVYTRSYDILCYMTRP